MTNLWNSFKKYLLNGGGAEHLYGGIQPRSPYKPDMSYSKVHYGYKDGGKVLQLRA